MPNDALHPVPAGSRRPRVVIVGGGFGGLYCARALRRAPVHVTVLDRRNFHLFQPLLYQVATASLSPGDIASPIRHILRRQRNAEIWLAEAVSVDVNGREVKLRDGRIGYDYLIVSTGVTHAYFGHEEWAQAAPGLKTIEDAVEIRRRFLLAFETAEREADPAARRRLLTFVIVGGGATGVELAGAMVEIARQSLPRDFRAIDPATARIVLLEGGSRLLPTYPEDLSAKAEEQLARLGVEVRTGALVTRIQPDAVYLANEQIPTRNIFWAAGVAASALGATLGAPLDRAGRVIVQPDCSMPDHPEVFVIGDLAHLEQEGELVPGVAPAAMQMGSFVAEMIRRDLRGQPRRRFRYRDKGILATIGRAAAVGQFAGLKFSGYPAWLVWLFVHILYLIGFRNRVLVMIQWAWAYFTRQRGVRLITGYPGETEVELRRPRIVAD
ncbi:MAG: NAD(P)/FAD-dependent oxidoreductase [Gemmatimonadetes bacterium]|nr:NAD(P)/FAD-dependent oxidoreductase [Gemmatimonadota bacterium]